MLIVWKIPREVITALAVQGGDFMPEIKVYTVATGNVNPLVKASREAVKFIKKLDGFVGVHPEPPHGTLWLFKTENQAKKARNKMEAHGIQTGNNICECFIPSEVPTNVRHTKN